jgi:hypothetical protein
LDGVGRPGKSHWPPLVSWPPTYSPIHLPFIPGTSQMLSLSFTTYLHTTSTFLDPYNHWPLLTLHLSSPPLPPLFCAFGLSETLPIVCYMFHHVYTSLHIHIALHLTAYFYRNVQIIFIEP